MIRKFWLTNSIGEKFESNDHQVFTAPTGFGRSINLSMVRIGNAQLCTNALDDLQSKAFEVDFFKGTNAEKYLYYNKFMRFVMYEPLYLHYLPPFTNTGYFMQVKLQNITKTEVGQDRIMRCSLSLTPLTMWFDEQINEIQIQRAVLSGKSYPLIRPYNYGMISTNNIELFNNGMDYAPLEIIIDGECTNPQYNLFDNTGTRYGIGKFNGSFDKVTVNTNELDENIELIKDDAVLANPYNYQDLSVGNLDGSVVTFVKLRPGLNKMSFLFENEFNGNVIIRWRNTYASV